MTFLLRAAFPVLLLFASGCDNVGRAFDRDVNPDDPDPGTTESTIEVVPIGGDVRTGRPKVRATYPSGGGWPTGVPIVVEFSESVNQRSILPSTPQANDARVIVRAKGTTTVIPCLYDFLAQGRLLVMRPITELPNNPTSPPTYEVVLLPDARDADGLRFDVATTGLVLSEFQVNQDETFVDGRILAVWPRDNAQDLPREADIVVVFDRAATVSTLVAANFRVQSAAGVPVVGDIDTPLDIVDLDDGRVVQFTPTTPFLGGTGYELAVTADIRFGQEGDLDFRGRTPFAQWETVAPAAPNLVRLGNPSAGFDDKINAANVADVRLVVNVDGQVGDKVRARIYGGNRATTPLGDRKFVERTVDVTQTAVHDVTVDFTGALGNAADPVFDDDYDEVYFVAQLQRGSQTSGFAHHADNAEPAFDVTPPTVQRVGPPAAAGNVDVWTDLGSIALFGTASERLAEANATIGATVRALLASSEDGRFYVQPVDLGRLTAPLAYTLQARDRAGNFAIADVVGTITQRGLLTGTVAGTLTVEAYDQVTLAPVAGALVIVDNGPPTMPATPSTQGNAPTQADGRVVFNVSAPSHTITIVAAGYDLVTVFDTTAAFVSLPLRPLTGATATSNGNVLFQGGAGVTTIVSNTAYVDRSVAGVQTLPATPNTIPDAAIAANRPQIVTAFAGNFDPIGTPPFAAHGTPQLGATLSDPNAPLAPAAPGTESELGIVLLPSVGQLTPVGAWSRDFATAADLDLNNLVGPPRVRATTSLRGFEGQLMVGIGRPTTVAGTVISTEASTSVPLTVGLGLLSEVTWLVVELQDTAGRMARSNGLVTSIGPVSTLSPRPMPTITAPVGAFVGSPLVTHVDALQPEPGVLGLATFDVTATDTAGRRWLVVVPDRDAAAGQDSLQFPDLALAAAAGLAPGTWSVRAEARVWSALQSGGADDCLLTERIRLEVEYARGLAVPFTVQ
jgi:hypothetical protein